MRKQGTIRVDSNKSRQPQIEEMKNGHGLGWNKEQVQIWGKKRETREKRAQAKPSLEGSGVVRVV